MRSSLRSTLSPLFVYPCSVGGDAVVDFEGEGEGGAAGFGWDAGWCAGADGVEEVFELEAKGFAF
jgi:hypothetical protein